MYIYIYTYTYVDVYVYVYVYIYIYIYTYIHTYIYIYTPQEFPSQEHQQPHVLCIKCSARRQVLHSWGCERLKVMQSSWRTTPFPVRRYYRVSSLLVEAISANIPLQSLISLQYDISPRPFSNCSENPPKTLIMQTHMCHYEEPCKETPENRGPRIRWSFLASAGGIDSLVPVRGPSWIVKPNASCPRNPTET